MLDAAREPSGTPAAAATSSARRAARGTAQELGGAKNTADGSARRQPAADSARFLGRGQPDAATGSGGSATPHESIELQSTVMRGKSAKDKENALNRKL